MSRFNSILFAVVLLLCVGILTGALVSTRAGLNRPESRIEMSVPPGRVLEELPKEIESTEIEEAHSLGIPESAVIITPEKPFSPPADPYTVLKEELRKELEAKESGGSHVEAEQLRRKHENYLAQVSRSSDMLKSIINVAPAAEYGEEGAADPYQDLVAAFDRHGVQEDEYRAERERRLSDYISNTVRNHGG